MSVGVTTDQKQTKTIKEYVFDSNFRLKGNTQIIFAIIIIKNW
jgi:hypothetical protein